jgi:mRNA-degrading endonuclease RelE of RelBE toxin-antitoxin system
MQFILHPRFNKKFKKLSPKIQEKFFERAEIFKKDVLNSILNNHSVDKAYPGCRSINIGGDYRALYYEIDDMAIFINIGTHSELYG